MSEHVGLRSRGASVDRLARPERRNAITVAMYAAFADALDKAASDPAIRLIRLSGDGQDFAAGNDLADFLTALPRDLTDIPVWRMLRALASCEVPILAQVQGNCVGIGTTMLLHCDLVVAEDNARFSLPFVDLGLVPEQRARCCYRAWPGDVALLAICCRRAVWARRRAGHGHYQPSRRSGQTGRARRCDCGGAAGQAARGLRVTQRLLRQGARDEILERMEIESRCSASGFVAGGQGRNRRILCGARRPLKAEIHALAAMSVTGLPLKKMKLGVTV